MAYLTASDYRHTPLPNIDALGSLSFRGPLHAYRPGSFATVCGLTLSMDAVMHQTPWESRPVSLDVCPRCAAAAG